jgi:epoxyqueuosine reductase
LGLVDLLEISRSDYEARFRGSPMKRAKRSGLRRNAAVAMGNRRRSHDVPALARALGDPEDEGVRRHAAWALGRIGGDDARAALRSALDRETEPEVRAEIEAAIAAGPPPERG